MITRGLLTDKVVTRGYGGFFLEVGKREVLRVKSYLVKLFNLESRIWK